MTASVSASSQPANPNPIASSHIITPNFMPYSINMQPSYGVFAASPRRNDGSVGVGSGSGVSMSSVGSLAPPSKKCNCKKSHCLKLSG